MRKTYAKYDDAVHKIDEKVGEDSRTLVPVLKTLKMAKYEERQRQNLLARFNDLAPIQAP
ncbi:MAG TPA: hypothetical protein DCR55_01460 [Lentisphaeria bacterium]|nr:hypothetical protein [Lentisphaeria bacterium]